MIYLNQVNQKVLEFDFPISNYHSIYAMYFQFHQRYEIHSGRAREYMTQLTISNLIREDLPRLLHEWQLLKR